MGEPSTQTDGLGERRRRREAERARAAAAGGSRPLTRRELRARELEEQARLEAIASGELQLGDGEATPPASPASPSGQSPEAVAPTAQSSSAVPSGQTPPLAPTAHSASAVPSAVSAPQTPTAQTPSAAPSGAHSASSAGGVHSAHSGAHAASADHAPSAGTPGGVSRRSMRDRLRDAPDEEPTPPSARTATGRRPVRTPSTARGIRTLQPTGQLSGIHPVARDFDEGHGRTATATAVRQATVTSADPAAWESALDLPPVAAEQSGEFDPLLVETAVAGPAVDDDVTPLAHEAPASREVPAEPAGDVEDEEEQPLRPRWAAVASAASPSSTAWVAADEAPAVPERRPVREQLAAAPAVAVPAQEEEWDEEDDEPRNPAVTALKYLLLIIAGVVIGALVAVLAFGDIGPAGAAVVSDLGGRVAALVSPSGA